MQLTKVKKSFNDYDLTLSWGQLEAFRAALEADHSEPVADEMLAELDWYMDRVPGPGEEEEEVKGREEGGMPVPGEGQPGEEGGMGVEMPPTEGGPADVGQSPQAPPEEMPGAEGAPAEGMPGEEAGMSDQAVMSPPKAEGAMPNDEEADQHLPAPPAE